MPRPVVAIVALVAFAASYAAHLNAAALHLLQPIT